MTTKTPEQIADESAPDFKAMGLNEGFRKTMRTWIVAAIEADRAQRDEKPACKVGDPDPTPNGWQERCGANHAEGFVCTWLAGHAGRQHVAGDGETVVEVWS